MSSYFVFTLWTFVNLSPLLMGLEEVMKVIVCITCWCLVNKSGSFNYSLKALKPIVDHLTNENFHKDFCGPLFLLVCNHLVVMHKIRHRTENKSSTFDEIPTIIYDTLYMTSVPGSSGFIPKKSTHLSICLLYTFLSNKTIPKFNLGLEYWCNLCRKL